MKVPGAFPDAGSRLRTHLRRGWRPAAFIAGLSLLGGLGGAAASVRSDSTYSASAQIFVSASSVDNASGLNQSGQFTQARVQSYVNVVNSPLVLDAVDRSLGLPEDEGSLAAKVTANAPLDKTLINVVVDDDDPQRAADIANAVAQQFIRELPQIETQQTVASGGTSGTTQRESVSPLKLTIIHPAVPPSAPSGLAPRLLVAVGTGVGLVAALALLLLRRRLSGRVTDAAGVLAITGAPPLAVLPWQPLPDPARAADSAITVADGPLKEAVRRLRSELRTGEDSRGGATRIAVASADRAAGASTVALELAAAYARSGRSVLLVDASMNPQTAPHRTLTAALRLSDVPGLAALATGRELAAPAAAATTLVQGLDVLPSGAGRLGGGQLHMTRALERVLDACATGYEVVVLDAGSVLAAADSLEVLAAADASVLVAAAGRTRAAVLAESWRESRHAGANVVGVVLNKY